MPQKLITHRDLNTSSNVRVLDYLYGIFHSSFNDSSKLKKLTKEEKIWSERSAREFRVIGLN